MDEIRKIFGTDGVRGRANTHPIDPETALALGRAVATVFKNGAQRHRIAVGKDTRLSGYMIETALASGICSMGADVMLVGPLPTPGIAFIARSLRADAGVVISASHNGFEDNGIKFFDRDGFKLADDLEIRMEELVCSELGGIKRPRGDGIGRAHRIDDAGGRYIQFLKGTFPNEFTLEDLRIVVDCANGAAYRVAPAVFQELGAEVIELGTRPDGTNINKDCGSLHPGRICELVKKVGADVGIALDGDADRVIMCDEKGNIVDGDIIMAIAALDLKRQGELKRNTLVATVMSNLALDSAMKGYGIDVTRTRVGDRHVIAAMRESGFNLGGEQSGHIIFLDYNTTGDGIVGALRLLSCMIRDGKPLSEMRSIFDPYPQVKVNIKVAKRREFASIPDITNALIQFKNELGDSGRLLMRYSGTENTARILVEGIDSAKVHTIAHDLANLVRLHLGEMPPM